MATISNPPGGPGDYTVLIIDTETTGLKADGGEIIEVAAVLYSIQYRSILSQVSTLLPPSRPSNGAVKINQIPVGAAMSVNLHHAESVCQLILAWASEAKYIVAHNAEFDRKWISGHWILSGLCQKIWLCTCYDFIWPKQQRAGMNLVHLALAHGIGVTCAHRALSDCQLIASLFSTVGDNLLDMMSRAARPKCRVLAKVHYLARDRAHNAGFKWDAMTRVWSRWVAIEDLPTLPVKYSVAEVDSRGNDTVMWARLWQMYIMHKMANEEPENSNAFEELGQKIWQCVSEVPALISAIHTLWLDSDRGSSEPKGLIDTLGAMEIWYWTAQHPLIDQQHHQHPLQATNNTNSNSNTNSNTNTNSNSNTNTNSNSNTNSNINNNHANNNNSSTMTVNSNNVANGQASGYNLPEALGSDSGGAVSSSENNFEVVTNVVEGVVEKVAQSCLEPEDRCLRNYVASDSDRHTMSPGTMSGLSEMTNTK